jgi:general secretion pathway protein J
MVKSNKLSTRGFTLLEVIVVLTITSLISAILMQGLSLILDTQSRVSTTIASNRSKNLEYNIIKTPIEALIPDYLGGKNMFQGKDQVLSGLTLQPLRGLNMAPTAFKLSLEYFSQRDSTALIYKEANFKPIELTSWKGKKGQFLYLTNKGNWENSWKTTNSRYDQVPRTIGLSTEADNIKYIVRIIGPHDRAGRMQDGPFR